MSHMQRVRDALKSTVDKLRAEIEESHKEGRIPADYSLGFTNGLIFAEHKINMRDGEPIFCNRQTSIGKLPKPVTLKTDEERKIERQLENLQDRILIQARRVVQHSVIQEDQQAIEIKENTVQAIAGLMDAFKEFDDYLAQKQAEKESKVS